ncbi:MAG: multidrug effflux MFS transporter [Prevotellaceae bacterium]|jgi:DHA1 family bicyclomycin/chloramphenicol resistance-like MFS transporter|nr:multidrug effflux MFS transporter [Prevotellaceae bacterium]
MKAKNQISGDLQPKNGKLYLLVTLSAMAAFAPLITDMYLPSLPALMAYFGTSTSLVQLTISTSMLGIAAGQLIFGPVSDKTGRRRPLFASFILYLLSTAGCLLAQNIYLLIGFRLLQGLGAAGSIVISRSVAADLFKGKDLLAFLALIAAVQGVAPIAAPVAGGVLLLFTSWKGIFFFLGVLGLAVLGVSAYLKESLPPHKRAKVPVIQTFKFFIPVVKNKLLMLYIALLSFSMATMFAYIASSPFIFQEHYGVSPVAYSIFFAGNALALTIGNILSAKRKNPHRTLQRSVIGLFACSLLTGILLLLDAPIAGFCLTLSLSLFFAGATFPISTNLALDLEEKYKGTASAVLGASTFLVGGAVMPLSGLGNILRSTAYTMAGSALIAVILLFAINKAAKRNFQKPASGCAKYNPQKLPPE